MCEGWKQLNEEIDQKVEDMNQQIKEMTQEKYDSIHNFIEEEKLENKSKEIIKNKVIRIFNISKDEFEKIYDEIYNNNLTHHFS